MKPKSKYSYKIKNTPEEQWTIGMTIWSSKQVYSKKHQDTIKTEKNSNENPKRRRKINYSKETIICVHIGKNRGGVKKEDYSPNTRN